MKVDHGAVSDSDSVSACRACAVAALKDVCDYFTRELGQVVVSGYTQCFYNDASHVKTVTESLFVINHQLNLQRGGGDQN